MKVIGHILCTDQGISVPFRKSPNTGGVLSPSYLIIHYDASATAEGAIGWMTSAVSKVSAHLHIDRAGKVVQMVPFNKVAWHAGKSEWKEINGLNGYSIGIELQNTGTQVYTAEQIDSLVAVSKALNEAYKFKEILGHSDISPGRKTDPGIQFPMEHLRTEVFGTEAVEANVKTAKVIASQLNVRSGAGATFPVLATINKDEQVNVLSEKDNWSEVFICGVNLKGWVSTKFIN